MFRTRISYAILVTLLQLSLIGAASAQVTTLDYRRGLGGNQYLTSGWTPPGEAIGVWTSGPRSEIVLPMRAGIKSAEIKLDVTAYIVPQRNWQRMAVMVGGRMLDTFEFDLKTFERVISIPIKPADLVNNQLRIILEMTEPRSPASVGVDQKDGRPIAIALRQITLTQE